MITNKLVRLEDVLTTINKWVGVKSGNHTTRITGSIEDNILALPTYPEPTKGSNHNLLQEYIDKFPRPSGLYKLSQISVVHMLKEIQSRLTEGTEYVVGGTYEFFYGVPGWKVGKLIGYHMEDEPDRFFGPDRIRPISISSEEQQAIELLEKSGYSITK